jgi:hypothetical protein
MTTIYREKAEPPTGADEGSATDRPVGLRERIRNLLAANPPTAMPGLLATERLARAKTWAAALYDNGFAGPAWPREFGLRRSGTDSF